jgi:hypothetical protein
MAAVEAEGVEVGFGMVVDVGGDTTTVERTWDVLTITMVVVNGGVVEAGRTWTVLVAAAEGVSVGVGISVLSVNRRGAAVGLAPVELAAAGETEMSIPNPASASLDVAHPIVTPDWSGGSGSAKHFWFAGHREIEYLRSEPQIASCPLMQARSVPQVAFAARIVNWALNARANARFLLDAGLVEAADALAEEVLLLVGLVRGADGVEVAEDEAVRGDDDVNI